MNLVLYLGITEVIRFVAKKREREIKYNIKISMQGFSPHCLTVFVTHLFTVKRFQIGNAVKNIQL